MKHPYRLLLTLFSAIVLIGCGGSGNSGNSGNGGNGGAASSKTIAITEDNQVSILGKGAIHATVNIGTRPKSLYLLLSNGSQSQPDSPSITHNAKAVPTQRNKRFTAPTLTKRPMMLHSSRYIQEFDSKLKKLLHKNKPSKYWMRNIKIAPKTHKDVANSSKLKFCTNIDRNTGDCTNKTNATARKVLSNIHTQFGKKTLNIWVSDDSFGIGCPKAKCVTQAMVDTLANSFLKAGDDNDIYDWDTNIFGEEWGDDASSQYSALISDNNEITILLTDIDNDNSPSGGIIGYFYPKDTFKKSELNGSNERMMLYADAVMFANTDGDGFWQKEMYSTLAHEFQHMIHYYQKTILLTDPDSGDEEDTWINEMLSETMEDLIATKIQHIGPRGVDPNDGSAGSDGNTKGRYALFNENNTLSLIENSGPIDQDTGQPTFGINDYSKVSAFGTFLTRNYGGAKILHDIMKNNKLHEDAVMYAIHKVPGNESKTFDEMLKEWGVAVLLSDQDNLDPNKPTYNTGDFTPTTYKHSTYELGSINFFNYGPQPYFSNCSSIQAGANCYYKVGDNLTGTVTIDLSLGADAEATLIAK